MGPSVGVWTMEAVGALKGWRARSVELRGVARLVSGKS